MAETQTEPDASSAYEDSLPTTSGAMLALLEELGIEYTLHEHPPLRTVEDSRNLRPQIEGTYTPISDVIGWAIGDGLIRPYSSEQGNRNARYVPYWF